MPDADDHADLMHSAQMRDALQRQLEQRVESQHVDRTGWTRQQWIDDARALMNHPDGAITSLVNGHVMALLDEAQECGEWKALGMARRRAWPGPRGAEYMESPDGATS